ncbi:phosphoglycerate dehydrogenase [Bradyrhizobium sp. SRL28]|uniref:2-hydroxyacid dehydrogenase n=1 Tax=Bradyrhizobium sp. SRL28 TaxID=2836178 RepID=UPI001BDE23FA|nr:2-hydroxyacid dehydrogenase [Bradyrhizobium sp. SRL28]MBT1516784.1 phosphoglycerate dehydrogenase [Bradyrhizobium sp. SRL28]
MKVLCLWHATEDEVNSIRKAMPRGTEVVAPKGEYFSRYESTYSELEAHAVDADAFIGFAIPNGLIEIARNLKLICWLHSGVDELDLQLMKKRGVKLANVRGANAVAVAEQAMMLMLSLAKKTLLKHQAARESRKLFPLWGDEHRSAVLHGRTLGVIGAGSIGSRIAKDAKGFEMHVLGVRRNKGQPAEYVDSMHGIDELHSVLPKCDYVVLATPLTKETNGFFGKPELNAMKPTAFLINVGRGNVVQEKALYEALTSGRLRGYAADVWWDYDSGRTMPRSYFTPSRLGIEKLPNVLCSLGEAHNADDVRERDIEWGIQSLVEFAAGKPLTREINVELGY